MSGIALILIDAAGRPIRRIDGNASLRAVADEALRLDCRCIALEQERHGSPLPSPRDIAITRRIGRLFRSIDIRVVDHVINGASGRYSFRANGLL